MLTATRMCFIEWC